MTIARVKYALTPEHLEAIGLIAATWAALEAAVEQAIWAYGEMDEIVGRSVTSQLRIQSRLDILEAIVTSTATLDLQLITPIRGEIGRLEGERNKFVHGLWIKRVNGEPSVTRWRARGMLKSITEPTSLAEMLTTAQKISDVTEQVLEIATQKASLQKSQ